MSLRFCAIALIFLSFSSPLTAETCWRGLPAPECDSFWITEVGLAWRQTGVENEFRAEKVDEIQIRYELGHMFNLEGPFAVGGTLTATGNQEVNFGVCGRIRYWKSRNWSFDLAPGIVFSSNVNSDDYSLGNPAFSARLIVNYADFVGMYAGLEQVRVEGEKSDLDIYLGLHAASYPGAALGGLMLLIGVIAAASGGLGAIQ